MQGTIAKASPLARIRRRRSRAAGRQARQRRRHTGRGVGAASSQVDPLIGKLLGLENPTARELADRAEGSVFPSVVGGLAFGGLEHLMGKGKHGGDQTPPPTGDNTPAAKAGAAQGQGDIFDRVAQQQQPPPTQPPANAAQPTAPKIQFDMRSGVGEPTGQRPEQVAAQPQGATIQTEQGNEVSDKNESASAPANQPDSAPAGSDESSGGTGSAPSGNQPLPSAPGQPAPDVPPANLNEARARKAQAETENAPLKDHEQEAVDTLVTLGEKRKPSEILARRASAANPDITNSVDLLRKMFDIQQGGRPRPQPKPEVTAHEESRPQASEASHAE